LHGIRGSGLAVCREHVLTEDRQMIDHGCDEESRGHGEHYARQLERRLRAAIREWKIERAWARVASGARSGWGKC
jgi:hypothetical protein